MTIVISDEVLADNIGDRRWRLNNLYSIVDNRNQEVRFKMNYVQNYLYDNYGNRNLIVKARKYGISTLNDILLLDSALFTPYQKNVIFETNEATFQWRAKPDAEHSLEWVINRLPKQILGQVHAVEYRKNVVSAEFKTGSFLELRHKNVRGVTASGLALHDRNIEPEDESVPTIVNGIMLAMPKGGTVYWDGDPGTTSKNFRGLAEELFSKQFSVDTDEKIDDFKLFYITPPARVQK